MRVTTAVALLFAVYFPMAMWLKAAQKEPIPLQPLPILGVARSGLCVSRFWQPNGMTGIEVFDGIASLGHAIKVYDDPGRLELATKDRRWKLVEFTCPHPRPPRTLHGLPANR